MTHRTFSRRPVALALGAALALSMVASCGSDDDGASSEEQFCAAGESLEADVASLASLDVVASGTDGLTEGIDAVKADLDDMKESASDVAASEIEALETAVDDVNTSLDDLGGDITAENATALVSALGAVSTSATAVYDVLSSTCP